MIFQHLPVKEEVKNIEVNCLRNCYVLDTLTSVDIQEINKIEGKVIQFYEGVIHRKNFKITPIRKDIEKLLALRQKYKDERNALMQNFVKLIKNTLSGIDIRKKIMNFLDVNVNIGCKQSTTIKYWIFGNYEMDFLYSNSKKSIVSVVIMT